ncbi:MAG TPA: phosphatidate cytidylyltransferase [Burkholderiales bacterium]|jgi:phosphatidate cytidylyltransferase|nr:phosphatidate cytidylyltransferase [Burkholderiales bacterium]
MLRERLITVAVLLPLLLGLMFFAPNPVWTAAIGVAVVLAAVEWARLCALPGIGQALFAALVAISGTALFVAGALPAWRGASHTAWQAVLGLAVVFWAAAVPCWLYFGWRIRQRALLLLAGWMVLVPAWLATSAMQKTPLVLFLTLCVIWLADTAAYFVGRRFGRRKLAPAISPGKTIEGLVGAYAAVLLYVMLIAIFPLAGAPLGEKAALVVFAMVLTTLSVAGDLFESWIKRQAGAKDSGHLLPGHGGVLDRIDSVTAAMPFAALYLLHARP